MAASEWVTALSTLVLTIVTGYYAWLTRQVAKAALESATAAEDAAAHGARAVDTAERALLAQTMPLLITEDAGKRDSVRVVNIGKSTALNVEMESDTWREFLPRIDSGKVKPGSHSVVPRSVIVLEYSDAIGYMYRTECNHYAGSSMIRFETFVRRGDVWVSMLTGEQSTKKTIVRTFESPDQSTPT